MASASSPAASAASGTVAAAVDAAQLQEGLLSRLDDKLDELEAANRLSRPQLQEEDYVPGSASTPGPQRRQPLAAAVRDLTCQWSEGFHALAQAGDTACMFIVAQMHLAPRGYGSLGPDRPKGIQWLMRAIDAGDIEARAYARKAAHKELMEHLARKHLAAEAAEAAKAAAAAAAAASTAASSADSAASPAAAAASSSSSSSSSAVAAASPGQSPHDPDESALRIAMEQMALRELDVAAEEQKQRAAREAEFGE